MVPYSGRELRTAIYSTMPPPQAAAISSRMTYSGNSKHANGCPATAKTSDKIIHLPTATGNHRSSTSATMSNIKSPNKSNVKKAATATTKVSFLVIKYVFLAMLILLVCGLLRINIQLIQRLDGATSTTNEEATAAAAMASAGEGVEGGHNSKKELLQLRLKALRSDVAMMKEKVEHSRKKIGHMKHILKQGDDGAAILTSNEDASERRKGGRVGDIDNSSLSANNISHEFPRHTCTPTQTSAQSTRLQQRFVEWWSHSACPDQIWMNQIDVLFDEATKNLQEDHHHQQQQQQPYLIFDIGCNKGYTSADFLDALSPGTNMNPQTLVTAIRSIASEDNIKIDRDGGVCNDSKKILNRNRDRVRNVEVHCFEPSPATFHMLVRAHDKLMPRKENGDGSGGDKGIEAKWFIHNKGLHKVNGYMAWHSACAHAVGDELCTIVEDGTKDAISVPVVTVDKFLEETYPSSSSSSSLLPLVHMLKIDAEGLDPAVLEGATNILTQNRAIMVMFEFNPGLSEKGDHPHGMWGKRGNPRVNLLDITSWLDTLGYDCYLDTHLPDEREKKQGVLEAPALYRITGDCMTKEPSVRGWANVVCASRKYGNVADRLFQLATILTTT